MTARTPPLLLALSSLFACSAAEEQGWRGVSHGGSASDRFMFFVDTASIKQAGGKTDFRNMLVLETADYDGTTHVIEQMRVDCASGEAASLKRDYYVGARLDRQGPGKGAVNHVPGSPIRLMLGHLCERNWQASVTSDPPAYAAKWFREN